MHMKTMNNILYSSYDIRKQKHLAFSNTKDYGWVSNSGKKTRRRGSKCGSASNRSKIAEALSKTPTKSKGRNKDKVKAIVSTSLYFNKNIPKKFKKEIISKQPSYKNILDGRNSLNKFINLKEPNDVVLDYDGNVEVERNTSVTKISKIEFQVKRHWLKKKKLQVIKTSV